MTDLSLRSSLPNEFSLIMGDFLKQAREEKGVSQATMARDLKMRRPSISSMENGRMVPDIIDLVLISSYLDKPITFFIHEAYRHRWLPSEETNVDEMQLLLQYRRLRDESYQRLAIAQLRALANFEQAEMRDRD